MELEILKLIYNYSAHGQLIDVKFIDKLVEIIIVKNNLQNYVRDVRFTDKLEKRENAVVCAAYSHFKRKILVDYVSIQLILENRCHYDQLFNSLEQIMFRNLTITQFILHELEHALQYQQFDNKNDDSLEAKLVKASFKYERILKDPRILNDMVKNEKEVKGVFNYLKTLYRQFYDLNPTERLAQVKSFRLILDVLQAIKKYIPNLYEFTEASLIEEMLKGYPESWEFGSCPTQVYLFGYHQNQVWYDLDFYDSDPDKLMENVSKYNLPERLSLGLPISIREYNSTNNILQRTNKYNV